MDANSTPEMRDYFGRMKMETAIINKAFWERNLSERKKIELSGGTEESGIVTSPDSPTGSGMTFMVDDDD